MIKLKVLLSFFIIASILLIGVNQAVGAQELQSDRIMEILLTRVNAILIHLFGDVPAGCQYANPLCDVGESCVDNVCVGEPVGMTCTDTDDGKDYSIEGTTSVCPTNPDMGMPCTAFVDHCLDDDLKEGFCSSSSEMSTETVSCQNGCQDGRCLPNPQVEADTTSPIVLIKYFDGNEYSPLFDDTLISLPQSYPTFSVSVMDDQSDTVSCRFYDDTSGSLSSDGDSYDFDNPIVLEPIPMVDSDFDPAEPKLTNGTYRFEVVCEDESSNAGTSGVIRFQWESKYVAGDCTFRTNAIDGNYRSGTWIAVDVDGDSQLEGLGYSGSTGMLSVCRPGTIIAGTPEGYPVILDAAGDVSVCQPVSETKISMKKYHVASSSADTSTTPRSPYDVNGQEVCDGSTPNPDIDFTDDGSNGGTTVSGNIFTGTG